MLALHHALQYITFVGNIIVTIIYWPFLFKKHIAHHTTTSSKYGVHRCVLNHTIPITSIFIAYYFSTMKMILNHCFLHVPLLLAYTCNNFYDWYANDRLIYHFIDWSKPITTVLIIFVINRIISKCPS